MKLYYKWNAIPIRTRGGMNIQIFGIFQCFATFEYALAYSNILLLLFYMYRINILSHIN